MGTNAGKNKVKIALVVGVFSLIVLAFVLLVLEGTGTFVGSWMNRPVAASYIDCTYEGLEVAFVGSEIVNETVERMGIGVKKKCYRFEYIVASYSGDDYQGAFSVGDKFYIEAYNFDVVNDGLYSDFLADDELTETLESSFLSALDSYDSFDEKGIEPVGAYYDLCVYENEFDGSAEQRLAALLVSDKIEDSDCVVHFQGAKIDFEKYKETAAVIVEFFKENKVFMPGFLQIIYYYENNGERVMQYESQFEFYELEYESQAIINGPDMHYIVELDESQALKLKIFNIVKIVYLVVVTATVFGLSTLWVVKKVCKLKKREVVGDEGEQTIE